MSKKLYGVSWNLHPSEKEKGVRIHKIDCCSYKLHTRRKKSSGIYTHNRDCWTFEKALEKAFEISLNWNAKIRICKRCLKNCKPV